MTDQLAIASIDSNGVARITMNRPEVRNAFNNESLDLLCNLMGQLTNNDAVRVIVITGAGNSFCAGADLNMMRAAAQYSASENKDDARRLAHMLEAFYDSPKPTIALINGPALGGAIGIIAACDIAIASDEAFYGLTEARVGLIPGIISPFVVEAIGARQARRFFLTGERFNGETAKNIGLVHKLVKADQLEISLAHTVKDILGCGPEALEKSKQLIKAVAGKPIGTETREDTAERIAERRGSKEGQEGMNAFLEKRKPSWVKDKDS